jgi:hypothetical protein
VPAPLGQAAAELFDQLLELLPVGRTRSAIGTRDVGRERHQMTAATDALAVGRIEVAGDDLQGLAGEGRAVAPGARRHPPVEVVIAAQHLGQERPLGAEVPVKAAARQPRRRHDLVDTDAVEAAGTEQTRRRRDDARAGALLVFECVAHPLT